MSDEETIEPLRRVLFELSMTEDGSLEVHLDYEMKPITMLAVSSALEFAHQEIKERVMWGGEE